MTQAYADPSRDTDPYALPDVELFRVPNDYTPETEFGEELEPGWYWWPCFPGCLPDGEAIGPFETEEEALADAQERD